MTKVTSWQRWVQNIRLWFREMRLRSDLQYSRSFKKTCEQGRCPNLAKLEEEYIHKVQHEIATLQQRRRH
jgi:hypothetical protein